MLSKQCEEIFAGMMNPRPNGVDRNIEHVRDFFARVAFDLEEHKRNSAFFAHL